MARAGPEMQVLLKMLDERLEEVVKVDADAGDADAALDYGVRQVLTYSSFTLATNKWHSSPPVSLSLKGNIIDCGRKYYGIVHGKPIQLKPVWYSGYLHRFMDAYERSGVRFFLLH